MKTKSHSKILLTMLIFFFLISMILQPARFLNKSLEGLSAWAFNVLPSVLPFMFFTRVLSSLDCVQALTRPFSKFSSMLFKTPPISIYAFSMAILSGYPVGSKLVADLFLQGKITKEEAFKMSSFCSTSGPMFIVGAVGIGMFKSAFVGYVLFLSHVLGAFLNGICYRSLKLKTNEQKSESEEQTKKADLSDIVLSSTLSILSVGCIITIFFIIIEALSPIFSIFPSPLDSFLEGIVEITKGSLELSKLSGNIPVILCSFVISFGGISTILQSLTMLKDVKMPVKLFTLQKFTHAMFSSVITALMLCI